MRAPAQLVLALAVCVSVGFVSAASHAAGQYKNLRKYGDGRTSPTRHYHADYFADPARAFGNFKTVRFYEDPDIGEALLTPDPLDNTDFDSYEIIVVIVKEDGAHGRGQTMRVYQRGEGLLYYWLISTGKPGFETRRGHFTPQSFSSRHWSSRYDSPMDWSIFFDGGRALHSSWDKRGIKMLGRKFSHGCVHVSEYRAEELFHLIGRSGYGLVDQVTRGGRRTGRKVRAYRTLIIVV